MDSQCRFGWRKKRPPKALTAALVLTRNSNTNTGLALLFRPASGLDFSTLLEDGKHPFAARIFDHAALTDDGADQIGRRAVEYRVESIETHWRDRHATEFREFAGEAVFVRNMVTLRAVEIEGNARRHDKELRARAVEEVREEKKG